jgi:hypothetical protein
VRDYCCGTVYVVKVIWQTCCSKIVCSKEVIAVVTAITSLYIIAVVTAIPSLLHTILLQQICQLLL